MDATERLASQIRTAVSIAVNLLVQGEFDVHESLTRGRWLFAAQRQHAVAEYPHRLVHPPNSAWDSLDVVHATDLEPATFLVDFPLWTDDEGLSDLTLQLRLVEAYPSAFETEINDLHVL
jgi:hypothetical protein